MEILNNNIQPSSPELSNTSQPQQPNSKYKYYLYLAGFAFLMTLNPSAPAVGVRLYRTIAILFIGSFLIGKGKFENKKNLVIVGNLLAILAILLPYLIK